MRTIAFCLFKYFPHGGLQRDFMRIAKECQSSEVAIRVYTMSWDGPIPVGFDVRILPVRGMTNHGKATQFATQALKELAKAPVDIIIGFNKMPGLNVYFASDTCFAQKITAKSFYYRFTPRSISYLKMENAVFSKDSMTKIMLISPIQVKEFQSHYSLDSNRFILLPPGLDDNFKPPAQTERGRLRIRDEFDISEEEFLILQVGSAFKTKGVDRVIRAIASLPKELRERCKYLVVGSGKQKQYEKLSNKLGIANRVCFAGVRSDVPSLMVASDVLVHPGRIENTGLTLLESLACSLPVVCSGICGYAPYISDSLAGKVLDEPYNQLQLNDVLSEMLNPSTLKQCQKNIESYVKDSNLCGLANKAVNYILEQLG